MLLTIPFVATLQQTTKNNKIKAKCLNTQLQKNPFQTEM